MHSRAALFIALCVLAFAGQPAFADKRIALVIGNSSYATAGRLANPANDAAAVAELLRRAQFDVVESKRDLSNTEMRRALREFSAKSRDADYAVVYYAGHGIEVDGTNYLLPVDTVLEQDSDAYDEAVALDRVLQAIEPARKLRLVILDACRDNPFARTMKRSLTGRSTSRGLASVEPGKANTLIAFAAKGGSIADDGHGSNSPYTAALLKHLNKPGLDLRKAFGLVRDEVIKITGSKQEPFLYGSLGGADVALVPQSGNQLPRQADAGPSPALVVPPLAANPHVEARRDYELALQLGTKQAFESYLAQYADGYFADLARGQLQKIATEEAHVTAQAITEAAEAEAKVIRERANAEARAAVQRAEADARAAEEARKSAADEAERLRRLIAKMESGGVASRPEPTARPKPVSDQVICDQHGCRPVKPGCRVSTATPAGTFFNNWSSEICR
jgi:uncharacterized caspase-like protein